MSTLKTGAEPTSGLIKYSAAALRERRVIIASPAPLWENQNNAKQRPGLAKRSND